MDNPITQENAETPVASPADQKTPEVNTQENVVASNPPQQVRATEEEAAWNTLKGGTQERIRELIRERDKFRSQVSQPVQSPIAAPVAPASSDEVRQAANILRTQAGFVTKEDLDSLYYTLDKEKKHDRLSAKYNGSDGLPKYDPLEVEDYMTRKRISDPEAAFRDMYFDEFVDNKRTQKRQVFSEKPGAVAGRDEPLTLESFREKLRTDPTYFDKISKDKNKFDLLLSQLTQE